MSLATVQDILSGWPGWTEMELSYGDQASGQGSGETIVKNLRDPLWTLHAESRSLTPNEIRHWKAVLMGLDNGRKLFLGYDLTAKYPASYPKGAWPTGGSFSGTTAQINSIGGDGVSITLKDLPAAFAGSVGDMLSVTYGAGSPAALALFRACEAFTANGSGVTGSFEVRPTIPAGMADSDVVSVKLAACHMMIVPGSIKVPSDVTGRGTISFDGLQVPTP